MDPLIERVAGFIEANRLIKRDQRVIVAVSGGLDSTILLHVLNALRTSPGWELSIAHFNHGLRGRESDRDERFVRRMAKGFGLSFESESADIRGRRSARGDSTEMTCRDARHEFLARVARKNGAGSIALAHHAGDQAELFLMRALRGAGGSGLAGMSANDPSAVDPGIRLVRPLLELSRHELRDFAERNQIDFREDSSNRSREHERNRARHEAIPMLEGIFERNVERGAVQSMRIIRDETEFVESATRAWLTARRRKKFKLLHPAVQRQCMRLQLLDCGIEPRFDWIEDLRAAGDKWISIDPDTEVSRDLEGAVRVRKSGDEQFQSAQAHFTLATTAGTIDFEDLQILWRRSRVRSARIPKTNTTRREVFDADCVGKSVTIRYWRPGDRFQPIGMDVEMKLQDWFTNLKIPRAERRKRRLAVSESGRIFWIEGCRIGDPFKLTDATKHRLVWKWATEDKDGCAPDAPQ